MPDEREDDTGSGQSSKLSSDSSIDKYQPYSNTPVCGVNHRFTIVDGSGCHRMRRGRMMMKEKN